MEHHAGKISTSGKEKKGTSTFLSNNRRYIYVKTTNTWDVRNFMNTFLRIDINLIAMILLGFVTRIAHKRLDKKDKLNQKFMLIAALILAEVAIETMTCLINNQPYPWLIGPTKLLHVFLFIVGPLITYLWFDFIHYWIQEKETGGSIRKLLFALPLVAAMVVAMISPFTGSIFSVSDMNVYQRGPWYGIQVVAAYFYLIASSVYVTKHKKHLMHGVFLPLFMFGLLPMVGGLLQWRFYGLLLMWSSGAFACVILYVLIQDRMAQYDMLTDTWTKATFERYMYSRVYEQKNRVPFGIIFIDMDDFKEINDRHGHLEGDYALKSTVELIKKVLRKADNIGRFGGDEFVVLLENVDHPGIRKVLDRMEVAFAEYNRTSEKNYHLKYSFGYEVFDDRWDSIGQFLNHVDSMMYLNKRNRKTGNRDREGGPTDIFQFAEDNNIS